jgi:hypothetical protein
MSSADATSNEVKPVVSIPTPSTFTVTDYDIDASQQVVKDKHGKAVPGGKFTSWITTPKGTPRIFCLKNVRIAYAPKPLGMPTGVEPSVDAMGNLFYGKNDFQPWEKLGLTMYLDLPEHAADIAALQELSSHFIRIMYDRRVKLFKDSKLTADAISTKFTSRFVRDAVEDADPEKCRPATAYAAIYGWAQQIKRASVVAWGPEDNRQSFIDECEFDPMLVGAAPGGRVKPTNFSLRMRDSSDKIEGSMKVCPLRADNSIFGTSPEVTDDRGRIVYRKISPADLTEDSRADVYIDPYAFAFPSIRPALKVIGIEFDRADPKPKKTFKAAEVPVTDEDEEAALAYVRRKSLALAEAAETATEEPLAGKRAREE